MPKHPSITKQYMSLLPIHEQLAEIDKMIEHTSNVKYPYCKARKRFDGIKYLKEVKRALIIMHIEKMRQR